MESMDYVDFLWLKELRIRNNKTENNTYYEKYKIITWNVMNEKVKKKQNRERIDYKQSLQVYEK
jgi:hypothetical protein